MSANVDVRTDYMNNAISVPITSVTTRTDTTIVGKESTKKEGDRTDEEEFTLVFVRIGNKARIRLVELGLQDDEFYQITSGLSEKDEIIVGPYDAVSKKLKNNMEVQLEE